MHAPPSTSARECDACVRLLRRHNISCSRDFKMWARRNHPDKGGEVGLFQDVARCSNAVHDEDCRSAARARRADGDSGDAGGGTEHEDAYAQAVEHLLRDVVLGGWSLAQSIGAVHVDAPLARTSSRQRRVPRRPPQGAAGGWKGRAARVATAKPLHVRVGLDGIAGLPFAPVHEVEVGVSFPDVPAVRLDAVGVRWNLNRRGPPPPPPPPSSDAPDDAAAEDASNASLGGALWGAAKQGARSVRDGTFALGVRVMARDDGPSLAELDPTERNAADVLVYTSWRPNGGWPVRVEVGMLERCQVLRPRCRVMAEVGGVRWRRRRCPPWLHDDDEACAPTVAGVPPRGEAEVAAASDAAAAADPNAPPSSAKAHPRPPPPRRQHNDFLLRVRPGVAVAGRRLGAWWNAVARRRAGGGGGGADRDGLPV